MRESLTLFKTEDNIFHTSLFEHSGADADKNGSGQASHCVVVTVSAGEGHGGVAWDAGAAVTHHVAERL